MYRWIVTVKILKPTPHVQEFLLCEPEETEAEIRAYEICRNLGGDSFHIERMD